LINAQEVIDMHKTIIKNSLANNKMFKRTELEFLENRLVGISKAIQDRPTNRCPFKSECKLAKTKVTHCLQDPMPSVLTMNVNWFCQQVPYMDTL
jgi:hypothetical protein